MQLGVPLATTRDPRSRLDEALDPFDSAVTDLIGTIENGGLDHLDGCREGRALATLRVPPQTGSRSSITT